ncbi:hypothetical protein PFISCL1PPCAC_17577, partial [Pristionchus fissidentatus]
SPTLSESFGRISRISIFRLKLGKTGITIDSYSMHEKRRIETEGIAAKRAKKGLPPHVVHLSDDDSDDKIEIAPREIYAFMMQIGIRLKLKNRSICTAILLMHQLLQKPVGKHICNYTLATAAIMVGLKYEEERNIGIKKVCHAAQSLVSSQILTDNCEEVSLLATGVGRLEYVCVREVAFQLNYDHPHTHLACTLQSLQPWMPEQFEKYPIMDTAASILRDAYICPELITKYPPKHVALAVVSLAIKAHDISVPQARSDWQEAFSSSLNRKELRAIEAEIVEEVYGVTVDR